MKTHLTGTLEAVIAPGGYLTAWRWTNCAWSADDQAAAAALPKRSGRKPGSGGAAG